MDFRSKLARSLVFGLLGVFCGAADLSPSCVIGSSANRARRTRAVDMSMSLLQVNDVEQALLHHAKPPSLAVLAVVDVNCAQEIRKFHRGHGTVGQSLLLGVQAIQEAVDLFMQSPPDIAGGTSALATKLLLAVEKMLPDNVTQGDNFASFRDAWMDTFGELPATVQAISKDIEAFEKDGEPHNIMNAVQTILTNATLALSRFVPEETSLEITRYVEAVIDVVDGIGNGLVAFASGDAPGAIESMYHGVRAAVNDLVPSDVQNDATYQTVLSLLDSTLGSISKHVLEYKQLIANSNVCWRGYVGREYERPSVCPTDYTWDGEQWCLFREVEPYTIESVSKEYRYLNVYWGQNINGANVQAYNNPGSADSQWRISGPGADGSYTLQNVAATLYLNVAGANAQVWNNPSSNDSRWSLTSLGEDGIFSLKNVHTGTYANLDCYWCLGASVQMSTNASAVGNSWRIVSAWRHAPLQTQSVRNVALLDQAVAKKQPKGSMPALCVGTLEKRGSWCYKACPAGYVSAGSRCQVQCASAYPIESAQMCGKHAGDISSVIGQIIVGSVTQVIKISDSIATGALTNTVQTLVDMGKPFAHPSCPV